MIILLLNACLSAPLLSQNGFCFNSNTNKDATENDSNNNRMNDLASKLIVLIGDELLQKHSSEFKDADNKSAKSTKALSEKIISTYLYNFDCFDVADLFFEKSEAREIIINCSSIVAHVGGMEHVISSSIQYFLKNLK
jgi:hypothetical protein